MSKRSRVFYLKSQMTHSGHMAHNDLYRVIAIHGDRSFREMIKVMITSFDLEFEAPYSVFGVDKDEVEQGLIYSGEGAVSEGGEKRLEDVFSDIESKVICMFGSDNDWRFVVTLIKMIEGCDKIKLPAIVQSHGEIPPPYNEYVYHS